MAKTATRKRARRKATKKAPRKKAARKQTKKKALRKKASKKRAARRAATAKGTKKATKKKASKKRAGAKKPAGRRKSAATRTSAKPAKPIEPIDFARTELKQSPESLGAHHSRMKPLAGEFRATVKMWMGPGEPHVSTGKMVNAWDLGGKFLKQVYKGDDMEGPFPNFEGRGYMGYNDASGQWEGVWMDNASTMMHIDEGRYDDAAEQWEMTGTLTNPQNGQEMRKRSVFRVLDNDRHTMESWFAAPDEPEFKAMQIEFERV